MTRTRLLLHLEEIIANHCSAEIIKEGDVYRQPVHYVDGGKSRTKSGQGIAPIENDCFNTIGSMQYTFGVHTVDIGEALDEILNYLENHCDFDPDSYIDDDTDENDEISLFD